MHYICGIKRKSSTIMFHVILHMYHKFLHNMIEPREFHSSKETCVLLRPNKPTEKLHSISQKQY